MHVLLGDQPIAPVDQQVVLVGGRVQQLQGGNPSRQIGCSQERRLAKDDRVTNKGQTLTGQNCPNSAASRAGMVLQYKGGLVPVNLQAGVEGYFRRRPADAAKAVVFFPFSPGLGALGFESTRPVGKT